MSSSGTNSTYVPLVSFGADPVFFVFIFPWEKTASAHFPSRYAITLKYDERALTALVPTPLSPTENWKTSSLYFAPVFMTDTHSTNFPRGMPRPKSRIQIGRAH